MKMNSKDFPRNEPQQFRMRLLFHIVKKAWNIYRLYGFKWLWKRMALRILLLKVRRLNAEKYRALISPSAGELKKQRKSAAAKKHLFHFGIVGFTETPAAAAELFHSLRKQSCSGWTLFLPAKDFPADSPQVKKWTPENGLELNRFIAEETGCSHWILLPDGTTLAPEAIFEFSSYLEQNPDVTLFYADDGWCRFSANQLFHYHFKPDFSPDTLRSGNYIGCSWCVSRERFLRSGGLEGQYSAASAYDLIFRLTEQPEKIGHIAKPLFLRREKPQRELPFPEIGAKEEIPGEIRALAAHLKRIGLPGAVEEIGSYALYRVRYELKSKPLISILIPNRDQSVSLKAGVDSILEKSTYRNLEIVVLENGSVEPETENLYRSWDNHPWIRVIRYPQNESFNYARLNNYGVTQCRGDYIVFMNNDITILSPSWAEEMLQFGQREEVGAVGAKLYFEDRTIQHAGVLVGYLGAADHYFLRFPADDPGYAGRLLCAQNLSAVTFAFCMVRKKVFEEAGGMDESLAVSFNDVDFCLKLRTMGRLVIWTPFAECFHFESRTRGYDLSMEKQKRLQQEIAHLHQKWEPFFTQGDPYYNPNLSLAATDFCYRHPAETELIRSSLEWNRMIAASDEQPE